MPFVPEPCKTPFTLTLTVCAVFSSSSIASVAEGDGEADKRLSMSLSAYDESTGDVVSAASVYAPELCVRIRLT